ncbi:MAG: response regulator [Anaerolineae bacterium]|nr:response regulator [Anaerolineae bacterium]
MTTTKPTYEELEQRCSVAEGQLAAIRAGQADAILGEHGLLVLRLAEAEEKARYIKNVLLTTRKVSHLIAQESEPEALIKAACAALTATDGYATAWIALYAPGTHEVTAVAAAGFELNDVVYQILQNQQNPPFCLARTQMHDLVILEDPATQCAGCPLAVHNNGRAALAHSLTFDNQRYGVLLVYTPLLFATDAEAQRLFAGLANELAFALHKMALEARRRATEQELKETLEALQTSELKLRTLFNLLPVGVSVVDEADRVQESNPALAKMLGLPRQEATAAADIPPQFLGADGSPLPPEEFPTNVAWREQRSIENVEVGVVTPGGETVWMNVCATPVAFADWRVLTTVSDITQRRQAEAEREALRAELLQVQKMESIGRLAGGVAHDFNNMLSVILGNTELALARVTQGEALWSDLQEIHKATQRSANLTRQLLAFARKQVIMPQVLDLNESIGHMLKMLQRLIGADIHLVCMPGTAVWPVNIDPTQIDQILVNLCLNARDAITGPGHIIIETANVVITAEHSPGYTDVRPGEYVQLIVRDDGCGMSAEVMANLFEPFFTTKEIGKGTGLGLATVYGIVRQNDGFIRVVSQPGKGATFYIYLPRHTAEVKAPPQEVPPTAVASGQETILLAEDEPAMLEILQTILEGQGYRVLPAASPATALQVGQEYAGELDLLITDVIMPEMNGRELAQNLLNRNTRLKVLFMSGYTADILTDDGALDDTIHFIQKPFSVSDLANKVRTVLGAQ